MAAEGSPSPLDLTIIEQALLAGEFERASELLDGCEEWPAEDAERGVLLTAEMLLHRDPIAAVAWLGSVGDHVVSDAARFAYNLLSARAFAVVRNPTVAAARMVAAESYAHAVPGGASELALYRARFRWYRGEGTVDDADLARALAHPDPNRRASAFLQRSWSHAANEDYAGQTADLRAALAVVDDAGVAPHVVTRAMIVFVLARVAFERADSEGVAHARRAFDALGWTTAVAVERYQALRVFGWDAFMRGATAEAQWTFREARECAPSDAWRATAHLDRAKVARIDGNEAWALDELYEAHALAQRIVWESTANEERMALVVFAELFASVDAIRAQWYAAKYSSMGLDGVRPNLVASRERRNAAEMLLVTGTIECAMGHAETAVASLEEAYALFAGIDHHFKAAQAASALAEATADPAWTARAVTHAERYPRSSFARTIAKAAPARADSLLAPLSPLQRQLAQTMIREGLDAERLSRRFSRSLYTIQREVAAIHATLGTKNVASLRESLRKRGFA
jgi:hypothetical protein